MLTLINALTYIHALTLYLYLGEFVLVDALDDLQEALRSMKQYIELADVEDVKVAKELLVVQLQQLPSSKSVTPK